MRLRKYLPLFALTFLSIITFLRSQNGNPLDQQHQEAASRIIQAALQDSNVWNKLAYLCDRIGNRLSGSPQLEQAVEWAARQMREDGLENVVTQPVTVDYWIRGEERGRIVSPVQAPLHLLGLGGSVATPGGGITAESVVVRSFDELESLGQEKVAGKIVVFNVPYQGYGQTVQYRTSGAVRAGRLGAAASLVRSVTPISLQTPHTGALRYQEGVPQIPAAAVTIEDAEMLQRLYDQGTPATIELLMQARTVPNASSANVIGEIVGRELPQEIVVVGGHLDSWDVGQGAHDDGGGVVVAMRTAALLKELGLRPRRTLRVVLWTNEENGLAGARAYRQWIGDSIHQHVAAIEMDGGAERPVGFGFSLGQAANTANAQELSIRTLEKAQTIGRLLAPIGADQITQGGGGADIAPLMREGVPGFGLRTVGTRYFDWHHTEADTLDKVNPDDLRATLAAMAVLAYVLAEMPERLVP